MGSEESAGVVEGVEGGGGRLVGLRPRWRREVGWDFGSVCFME